MSHHSAISTHDLSNPPPFSLAGQALLHNTIEEVVRRVTTNFNLPPFGPFEREDFYRINRVLMPVWEPYQIDHWRE